MPRRRGSLALVLVASSAWLGACAASQASDGTAAAGTSRAAPSPALTTAAGIAAARRYAAGRRGTVAFAVLGEGGRLRGRNRTVRFASASVTKAMLLVAVLRRAGHRPLSAAERALIEPMITESDNDAADVVYASIGGAGVTAVARAAGCRRFADRGSWSSARVTAADQARLFLRIDLLVPPVHRSYTRRLLSSIVPSQRWGIAPVARRHHMKTFFKGGWRTGLVHQVALLERDGRRIALAILTGRQPSQAYGRDTLRGIAARVLS